MAEFLNNNIELGTDYYIGTVMEIDKGTRKCKVYIPKLMMGLPENIIINNNYPVKTENIINIENLNISTSLTKTNIIEVQSYDIDEPMPEIGSLVLVYFLEGNPKYGYWEKFNPYGKYEVIESERYPKVFTLEIGDKKVQIDQDDYIKIDVPKEYEVVFVQSGKTKLIKIQNNNDEALNISELQAIVNNLNNNLNSIKQEKIETIEELISEQKTAVETIKASISDTLYTSVQDYLNYKSEQSNDLTLSLDDLKHNSKDVSNKTSSLLELITKCSDYSNYYANNLTSIPVGKVQEYELLTNETAQSYFEEIYAKIINIDSETEVGKELQLLTEKLSYEKKICYYYEDKENKIETLTAVLNNDFPTPTVNLTDIYNKSNPNDETTDEEYKELVVAAVSLHNSDNISSSTKLNETKVYKSQDVYLNLMNLDFIVDAIEVDDNKYSLVIIDESVISQNNKESDIKIDPNNMIIDVELDNVKYYTKFLSENSENVWLITTEVIADTAESVDADVYQFKASDLNKKTVTLKITYNDVFNNTVVFEKDFTLDMIDE